MSVIEKSIEIAAPREAVWRYFEDPDLLAGWLMRNDFKPAISKGFSFFGKPNEDWDGELHCKLVEFEPPSKIAFTWNSNDIGADTLVSVELVSKGEGTLLTLRHTNWAEAKGDVPAHIEAHSKGWDDHLAILKIALGDDDDDRPAPPIDWTIFRAWLVIDAKPERVFKAWASSGGMESFFVDAMQMHSPKGGLRAPGEIVQENDCYVWRWDSGRIVQGQVLKVRPGKEIAYTFGECKFRIHAHSYEGKTLLELVQYDMADTEENHMHLHTNCRTAWAYFMTNLKAQLEHGIDVRDKARKTGASFSTYFSPEAAGITLSGE